jgi:prepilin-type N-terminal cleavage/methylation domain-containing protein
MSGRPRMLRAEAGFTLIELLVTMAIMGVLLSAFGQMLITTSKSSARTEEQATLQDLARAAINGLTRDLREATNTLGTSPVETLSGTTLTFDAPDEATPFHLRRIAYRLVGGELDRSVTTSLNTGNAPWQWPGTAGPWTATLDSITNGSIFTYYDASGAQTTNPTQVRSVRITLAVAPKQNQGGTSTYSALVSIRTLQ